jgi:hypothetical protein
MSIEELDKLKEKEIQEKFSASIGVEETEWDNSNPAYAHFKAGYKAAQNTPSGNQYTGYFIEGNETLRKVHKDEPIFVLRAQDVTAPKTIMYWMAENLEIVSEAKLKEAWQTVLAMRRYSYRRDPT